ncbi:hypothetical protein [Vibrio maritimus]|nr:hypothetical protein [Vibrio maritimus]
MNTTLQAPDRPTRLGNLFPYHNMLIKLLVAQASELTKFKKHNIALKS